MNIFQLPNSVTDIFKVDMPIQETESQQRTEQWFKSRLGRFTGSEIYKLMGTSRATSKIEWGRPEKLIDFSETAMKYVYNKAKERQRNKVLKRSIGFNGEYGTEAEKQIIELLKIKYPDYKFEDVGFMEFIKGIAGASPDGLVNYEFNLEIKAAMTWDTLYTRFETPFTQSHQDFWQIQSEMLALNVDKTMYVIAEPPEDLYKPEITDLSEKIVKASPIHQEAIKQRCLIGNDAILRYLSGINFHEAIRQACTEFETPGTMIEMKPEIIEKTEVKQTIKIPF